VYTVGLALLSDTVGSKDMGQWMGYVITTLNVGMLVAPSVGGIIYERAGYHSVFAVTLGLIVLDILLRLIMVEKKVAAKWRTLTTPERHGKAADYGTIRSDVQETIDQPDSSSRPQITKTTNLPEAGGLRNQADSLSSGLHDSSTSREPLLGSKTSPRDSVMAVIGKAQQTPNQAGHVLPLLTLLGSPRVLTNLYGVMVTVTLLVSFDSALPLFVERTFGWGPTSQGLIFLTITLPIFAAPIAGKLSDMYPTRLLTSLWFLVSALFTLLLLLVTHRGTNQVVMLSGFLTLYGKWHRLIRLIYSVLVPLTDDLVASARVFGASPLGADLNRAVDALERDRPGIFGESGAKAQVFSLYTSASAAGVLIGPAWTSYAYGERNWTFLVSSLAVLNASVVVPVVRETLTYSLISRLSASVLQMLFFPSKRENKGDTPGKYPVDGRSGDAV
jgi:MFS family permease